MPNDLAREKLQLIEWILKQEKLSGLKPMMDAMQLVQRELEDVSKVVGHRAYGLRVSRKQLVDRLVESLNELNNGDLVSLEQLEQESDQW